MDMIVPLLKHNSDWFGKIILTNHQDLIETVKTIFMQKGSEKVLGKNKTLFEMWK